ncbi:hypothetical protein RCL1_008349 [Eukaryota sp. TZLM3-RCL]
MTLSNLIFDLDYEPIQSFLIDQSLSLKKVHIHHCFLAELDFSLLSNLIDLGVFDCFHLQSIIFPNQNTINHLNLTGLMNLETLDSINFQRISGLVLHYVSESIVPKILSNCSSLLSFSLCLLSNDESIIFDYTSLYHVRFLTLYQNSAFFSELPRLEYLFSLKFERYDPFELPSFENLTQKFPRLNSISINNASFVVNSLSKILVSVVTTVDAIMDQIIPLNNSI